jgi:WbqC-like protein family
MAALLGTAQNSHDELRDFAGLWRTRLSHRDIFRPTAKMRIAILQSCYIPWKGYFDLINSVDEFVLFDDVQFTRRDWRNRNRIKTPAGPAWLTIPVHSKGHYLAPINQIVVSDESWAARHWRTLTRSYARAPYFRTYADTFERLYLECRETRLSAINYAWITAICEILDIRTRLTRSMEYELVDGKTERLVQICRQAGATTYLSGPAARSYIQPEIFQAAGVELSYFSYQGYPEYAQLFPPFDHFVSILDLLFNEGPRATRFMLSFNP